MENQKCYDPYPAILKYYPKAVDARVLTRQFIQYIQRQYGLSPGQIVSAVSICSDDINNYEFPEEAREMIGPFTMGGLDGYPFTGLAGMNAFVHHVPKGGGIFIFFAPHIGISQSGAVGEILRPGQPKLSGCCGAAQGALANLKNKKIIPMNFTALDYQFNTIEQVFLGKSERILASREQLITATEVMYQSIQERMKLLLEETEIHCDHVFVSGGILINADAGYGMFVEERDFFHYTPAKHALENISESVKQFAATL